MNGNDTTEYSILGNLACFCGSLIIIGGDITNPMIFTLAFENDSNMYTLKFSE